MIYLSTASGLSTTVHALKIVGAYVDSLFSVTGFIHVYIDIRYDWNYS